MSWWSIMATESAEYTAGISGRNAAGRQGFRDDAAGADRGAVADGYAGQQDLAAADTAALADGDGLGGELPGHGWRGLIHERPGKRPKSESFE